MWIVCVSSACYFVLAGMNVTLLRYDVNGTAQGNWVIAGYEPQQGYVEGFGVALVPDKVFGEIINSFSFGNVGSEYDGRILSFGVDNGNSNNAFVQIVSGGAVSCYTSIFAPEDAPSEDDWTILIQVTESNGLRLQSLEAAEEYFGCNTEDGEFAFVEDSTILEFTR